MRSRSITPGTDWHQTSTGLLLPPQPRYRFDRPIAIDLFAGAGGFSCGLKQAGFHVLAAFASTHR